MIRSAKKANRHKRPQRRGATVVEFAIVAPVFFLLLLVSFEFSRLNVIRHTADNAAYEAARIGMVPGATAAEAVAEANRIMNITGARGTRVTVNPANLGPDTTQITVTVDVPMDQNGIVTPAFTSGQTMTSQATLRAERVEI
ncbi:MAG: TadE family protein [Planctomycetota bacterium]